MLLICLPFFFLQKERMLIDGCVVTERGQRVGMSDSKRESRDLAGTLLFPGWSRLSLH